MRMPLISSMIFTAVGVSLPIAAHRADMNESHIYNPRWSPHAKFHDGQTLSLSLLLGDLTTFLAWKPSRNVPMMVAGTGIACIGPLYGAKLTETVSLVFPPTVRTMDNAFLLGRCSLREKCCRNSENDQREYKIERLTKRLSEITAV